MVVYRFEVTDNNGTYELFGFVFGDQVKQMDGVGKTVTASSNGGYLRLTLGAFAHPSGTFYSCTGTMRHM
jgi:hypothetical protein